MSGQKVESRTGSIAANELYTVAEIHKRLGLGQCALRRAKKEGLTTLRIGRRDYVRGVDLIEFAVRMNENRNERPQNDRTRGTDEFTGTDR